MKKITSVAVFLLIIFIFAAPGFADTVWLDEVVLFDQPSGSSTEANDPTRALGADDNVYVSIDIPEILILAFTDNTAFDGTGNDLRIREYGNDSSRAKVYGSENGADWVFLIEAVGNYTYNDIFVDFNGLGLSYVNYLKFEGLDNLGSSDGFDLDAVEALNSGAHVPIPGAAWLLGSGLIGLIGLRRKIKN